jgi:acyl carrier protein
MDIEFEIKKIIAEKLYTQVERISNVQKFAHLGADSLDTVEIVLAIEDRFNVVIPDSDTEQIKTVQDAIDSLTKLLNLSLIHI